MRQGRRLSRKRLDDLNALAKEFGAGGLAWVKVTPDDRLSGRKVFDATQIAAIAKVAGAQVGVCSCLQLAVTGSSKCAVGRTQPTRIRAAARRARLTFLWVTEFLCLSVTPIPVASRTIVLHAARRGLAAARQ